jgi:hypothetical protein
MEFKKYPTKNALVAVVKLSGRYGSRSCKKKIPHQCPIGYIVSRKKRKTTEYHTTVHHYTHNRKISHQCTARLLGKLPSWSFLGH